MLGSIFTSRVMTACNVMSCCVAIYRNLGVAEQNSCMFLCLLQKQEKPKFVLCVTFAENGDAITGDSSGNILVWGKGT